MRSAGSLRKIFSNENAHPFFTEDLSERSYLSQKAFEAECKRQVEEYTREYGETSGSHIPLPLLHGLVSESLLNSSTKGSFHPSVAPEVCQRGMIERLWDQSLQKIHPDILQEVFQTPDRSAEQHDQASLYRNALEEYQFSYTPPTKRPRLEPALILDEEDIRLPDLVLDEEAVSVQRPFLTQNQIGRAHV